jgi:glyoxylase-like metal-dependent hydrolase (beta-lactamase superfamily II)
VSRLSGIDVAIGQRELRLLRRDFSLEPGESGKRLIGFLGAKSQPTLLLKEGDRVGSLLAVFSPGHTPGHVAFLDVRDNTLIAGDAFTTQSGVVAAGAFKLYFPFPALFSWNKEVAAESAKKLRDLKPERLAVGHGKTVKSPLAEMDKAIDLAFRQRGKLLH